jgi:hypothetical protein
VRLELTPHTHAHAHAHSRASVSDPHTPGARVMQRQRQWRSGGTSSEKKRPLT